MFSYEGGEEVNMKAYVWDLRKYGHAEYAVAVAANADEARLMINADINALQESEEYKAEAMAEVSGPPDEVLDPPFSYLETCCHHFQMKNKVA